MRHNRFSAYKRCLITALISCFVVLSVSTSPALSPHADEPPVTIPYKITKAYPHAPGSFTQGLVYEKGFLFEGTGQYGLSSLRKIKFETGEILKETKLPKNLFGEGITIYKDKIIQLTWLSRTGFVYDKNSFRLLDSFRYPVPIEGWGLTTDGSHLIMSDGSDRLYFLDPETYDIKRQLDVYDHRGPIRNINELECVGGAIYANVWQKDYIARISTRTGRVTGWINLKGILSQEDRSKPVDILNGIAYDAKNDRLFVTGKLWPKLFEIKLLSPN